MTRTPDGDEFTCSAGREADFGGRWLVPCNVAESPHCHRLITAVGEWRFCEAHMKELIAAGLISDPYVSEEGAEMLAERERRNPK